MISFIQRAFYHFSPFCGKTSIFLFLIVFLFRSLNILQHSILGSLTKVASSCRKLAKSDKNSLPKLVPTICTFLFHLSQRLAGNFETRKLLNDRMNFYHQRKKVYNLKANQIGSSVDCTEEDEEVTITQQYLYKWSLTMYSRLLLKETRKKCRQLNYQFTGYKVEGQVRATKSEETELIFIENMYHISNFILN